MKCNVGKILAQRAYLSPDREGFAGDGYRYSFKEANARANQFARYLQEQGISQGDRVAILCKNNEHAPTTLFGAAKIGAIAVLLNWRLQVPEIEYILNDCTPECLVYDAEFADNVAEIRSKSPVRICIQKGPGGGDVEFEEALSGRPVNDIEPTVGGSDPEVIMYTSGTTGKPKGAVLTHDNLFWSTAAISHTIEWNYDHRFLLVAPLFHIGGLAPLITNVHKGTTTFFMPNFDPRAVWATIATERITTMMSVPLMLQAMLMVAKAGPVDASTLKTVTCGASGVPESLIRAYLDMGIKVQQVYGITEYSGAVTFWTHDMPLDKCDSQGKPAFHGELKVVDPQSGEPLPAGEVGEIHCKAPMVFKEYWNNPEATRAAFADGWYRSGDLGKVDHQGFFYVVDRLKDMIISGGENIYPAELECVIATHPAVAENAVVGLPDSKWGEMPVAFVVTKPEQAVSAQEITDLCRERLAAYKCVKDVRFVDALPKNPVGKIMKTALREIK
jgi:O-succinylbenzoate-CoA ligase